jgi:hypothetical protein
VTISVHDNSVYAYFIDCENRRITLHSRFTDANPHEFTDIVFTNVLVHRFEHVLEGNILFDVEEVDAPGLVDDEAEIFRESWRYGWPPVDYRGNLSLLKNELERRSMRAYRVSSSYGLSGWILAEQCELIAASRAGANS